MQRSRFRTFLHRAASVEFVPCPACGRELRVDSAGGNAEGGYWYLDRPAGALEALCGTQHGTRHHVPIRWTPAPTARDWDEAKNSSIPSPHSRLTIGVVLFALALVAIALYAIVEAAP
jgi:hypothetical protein